jgi:hypothetical protein
MLNQAIDVLYSRARDRGRRGQVWPALTERWHHLLALDEISATCTVHACRYDGIRTVPISQIRGSDGRSHDFDCDFNPLQDHNKKRWLNVATARRQGKALPPVKLVQVGDVYFVLDGHHRISVARALGQQDIEAKVIVWQVTGPLPWERSATVHDLTGQEMEIEQLYKEVRDDSARLQERFLLSLRNFLIAVGMKLKAQVVSVRVGGL